MAKSVLDIVIKLSKQGGADKETITGLVQVKSALLDAAAVAGTFVAVGYTIDKVLDATVGKYVTYAAEVRRAADATGMSTEETSRLIQVLDDVKIEYGALEKVIQKNADIYDYSTNGLAAMSAEYLSLTSKTEQAAFMEERFGKGWISFVPLMKKGEESIRAMSAAVNENMIVTEKSSLEVQAYELSVNNLKDLWDGYTNSVGAKWVPGLTRMTEGLIHSTEMTRKQAMGLADLDRQLANGKINIAQYNAGVFELGIAQQEVNASRTNGARVFDDWASAAQDAAVATETLTDANDDLARSYADTEINTIYSLQSASEDYANSVADLDAKLRDGVISNDEYALGLQKAADVHEAATARIVFDLAKMQLAADGWQTADTAALMAIGKQLGIFSAQEATAAGKTINNSQAIAEAYAGMSNVTKAQLPTVSAALDELTSQLNDGRMTAQAYREKVMYLYNQLAMLNGAEATAVINLIVRGAIPDIGQSGHVTTGGVVEARASGGPLGADMTMVGEKGYELVVKDRGGNYTVIPHEASKWLVQAGVTPGTMRADGGTLGGSQIAAVTPNVSVTNENKKLQSELRALRNELPNAIAAAIQQVL